MGSTPNEGSSAPPLRLALAVALVAAAMLLLEIVVTRLFSVLFYYHFSFFAISLVMSGLVVGGLVAGGWSAASVSASVFENHLAALALAFAVGTVAALAAMAGARFDTSADALSVAAVAVHALVFLPGLVAAGALLALAFARESAWIGKLYASDLIGAALACLCSVPALRTLPGPAVLVLPALLAATAAGLLARNRLVRGVALAMIPLGIALLAANARSGGTLLRLRETTASGPARTPGLERWNEHSRVQAFPFSNIGRYLIIDRSAGTFMRWLPREFDGSPPHIPPEVMNGAQYQVYGVGRPVRRVAIIGVGGGSDLLPALYEGATQVDGYELNQILIDLLERDFSAFNALTSRPEVHLHHTEARVGIAHSGERYDVIQASLIDTWAATASGGFVLSENGLYTIEGWRTFFDHLSDAGILTMTRWYIDEAPAETHRLVSLAAAALSEASFPDAEDHIILLRAVAGDASNEARGTSTILVSKKPFTKDELVNVETFAARTGATVVAAPGRAAADPTIRALLAGATRARAIHDSPFDIAPPTDARPYFFLQVRPSDLVNLKRRRFGVVTEITFNGVRVMMILAACALALVLGVTAFIVLGLPGPSTTPENRRVYRWMTLYFLGIGFGYILVQLGLHQRLVVVLGHPTLALSVVLFCMLLGTSAGALSSTKLIPSGRTAVAGLVILGAVGATIAGLPLVPYLERIDAQWARIAAVGLIVTAVGFALGLAFPLGVRRVGPSGEHATQKMWAVNGAASIAGSALAALVGLSLGSTAVLGAGFLAYVVATASGALAERAAR